MSKVSEVDALKQLDEALSGLEAEDARVRVLRWAWEKFGSKSKTDVPLDALKETPLTITKKGSKKQAQNRKGKVKGKPTSTLSLIKDLVLKPQGKKSLNDFIDEKKPNSHYEKCAAAVYFMRHKLGLTAVTASHVYTCYKHMGWRVPTNLPNTLAYAASHYGWLDTSNMQDIKTTPMGENLIEHDLPKKKKDKNV